MIADEIMNMTLCHGIVVMLLRPDLEIIGRGVGNVEYRRRMEIADL
jgi:hypothetical protein